MIQIRTWWGRSGVLRQKFWGVLNLTWAHIQWFIIGIPGLLVKTESVRLLSSFFACVILWRSFWCFCALVFSYRHWIFHKISTNMNSTGDTYIIRYFSKTYYFYVTLLFADFSFLPHPHIYGWQKKMNGIQQQLFYVGSTETFTLIFSFA